MVRRPGSRVCPDASREICGWDIPTRAAIAVWLSPTVPITVVSTVAQSPAASAARMSGLWYRSAGTAACFEGASVHPVHRLTVAEPLNGRPQTEQLTDPTMLSSSVGSPYLHAYGVDLCTRV
ncbi:hypothetical protein Athai_00330 [Actinocatenispora thailandica]|uniref:Uncharacterized protein n=1 Tax=Actinocatenispora thailandica TaxID=227318 RepID=A0A7R7DIZ2_9ACTN|nr:hypothetical protein Athai_00330 [Actinocatenispora thailandica]